jgi:selenocysteine lyase/cysteine desulfurase
MGELADPEHLDFISISAHKMYAPFGTGALIGRTDIFARGDPDLRGGGEVEIVTYDSVEWSEPPDRDEAGSPNTIGAIALGAAISQLEKVGMDLVAQHEAELTEYLLTKFAGWKAVAVLGDARPEYASTRLGVIPMNLQGYSHYLLAAILGYEYGIGVRNGCFCAHPYLLQLMKVREEEASRVRSDILHHDKREVPGLVRVSFGLYNTRNEIDLLLDALKEIEQGKYRGKYIQDIPSGAFIPQGWQIDFDSYFTLD